LSVYVSLERVLKRRIESFLDDKINSLSSLVFNVGSSCVEVGVVGDKFPSFGITEKSRFSAILP